MAAAEGTDVIDVECGYCLEKGDQLVDPRQLPCRHVYCYPCLVGDFNFNRIVRCGRCREVFDVTLARLPSTPVRENNIQHCDVCSVKGSLNVPAVSYCVNCNRKMCNKHDEFHQDFLPEHSDVMKIDEFRANAVKLEVRKCSKHEGKPIVLGCAVCYEILCMSCVDGSQDCVASAKHQAVALEALVALLKIQTEKVKAETGCKEDSLYKLLKYSTKVLTDHDVKTEKMVRLLHTTRDRQLSEIRSKYDALERKLTEKRNAFKQRIVDFMEGQVGERLTTLNTLLLLQEGRFKDGHQVDIVSSYSETKGEIRRLIDEELPSLTVQQSKLQQLQDLCRTIDVNITSGVDIAVNRQTSMWSLSLPTSLKLTNTVEAANGYSLCSYQGQTYVGQPSSISLIEESDMSVRVFKSLVGNVDGIVAHNDRIYTLTYSNGFKLCEYNLNGDLVNSSNHDSDRSCNKLAVVGHYMVALNAPKNSLIVYSMNGHVHKTVTVQQTGAWKKLALSAVDEESVVISSTNTSSVFRVNINTEKVMWTSTRVNNPGGVTCYGKDFVFVAHNDLKQTEVSVLDARSGDYLGTLIDPAERTSSKVFDLHVKGSALVVPRYSESKVLFYTLDNGD